MAIAQLMAKVKGLGMHVTSLSEREMEHSKGTDQILTCIEGIETHMKELEGMVEGVGMHMRRLGGALRSVSGDHPSLKVCCGTILSVTYMLKTSACGVWDIFSDVWGGGVWEQGKCTGELCVVALLETGTAYEIIEDREVWHPVWNGKINDAVNVQFIKALAEHIWENKQVSSYIFSNT